MTYAAVLHNLALMRIQLYLAAIATPLCLLACDEVKQTANEHLEVAKEKTRVTMSSSAEKITAGVREAAAEAKLQAKEQLETLKQDGVNALNDAGKAAQEAADRIKASTPPAE